MSSENPYGQPQPYPGQSPAYGAYPQAPGYAQFVTDDRARFASWGRRVGASLLDSLVLMVVPWVFFIVALINSEPTGRVDIYGEAEIMPTGIGMVFLVLGMVTYVGLWIWNRLIRQGTSGQSIGKKAMGIRLVKESTGGPVGVGMVFIREILAFINAFFYLGYLWPLWDAKRQTFTDKIVGSVVVRVR
ncbi:MAG: RDD family protein [Cellulomonadaceae bacterium]